jgi:membrane-associated phospholipid phosphatase
MDSHETLRDLGIRYGPGFLLILIVLSTGIVLVARIPKIELHLLCNGGHAPFLDIFFRLLTLLGDGWVATGISLLFLFVRFRFFLMLILSFSVSGLLAQFLKHFIFPDAMRPAAFLDQMPSLVTVDGVDLYYAFSFPSGHTTTAFAVLLLLGFILEHRGGFFFAVLLAWFVAFSRVYLSQHFLADVLAGSVLGSFSALFFYWYFRRLRSAWLDRSLLTISSGRRT